MTYEKKVLEWAQVLDESDIPHKFEITFAAFLATTFSIIYPFWYASLIITVLSDLILESEAATFIQDKYLPELEKAIDHVEIDFSDSVNL